MLTTLNRVVRVDTLALFKGTQSQFWWQYYHPWGSVGKSQEKALGLGGHQEPAEARLQQEQGEALAKLLWLHRRGACRQHSFCLDALSTLFC